MSPAPRPGDPTGAAGAGAAGGARTNVRALRQVLTLRVTLDGIAPPIWRILRVPTDLTLARLHTLLQLAFGWCDQHLHYFERDGERWGIADGESHIRDQARVHVSRLLHVRDDGCTYVYDFGDCWTHRLEVVAIDDIVPGEALPRCLDGARAGPPEDCGGPWGYAELVEALGNRRHPRHHELREWLGGYFWPELFDLEETNERIARHVRWR